MVQSTAKRRFETLLLNIVVAVGGIIVAIPLIWMISSSFKPLSEIYAFPPTLIPQTFTTRNYDRLLSDWPFWNWYGNSLVIAVISTLAVLFFTSLAGFAFAKYRFKGSRLLFIVLLASTMIPFQLILVPTLHSDESAVLVKFVSVIGYSIYGTCFGYFPHAPIHDVNSF